MNDETKRGQATATLPDGPEPSGVSFLHSPVLVLNLNYVPINVCTARRAVALLGKGKAELLENHQGQIRTVSRTVDVPSIIRLVYLVRKPFLPRKLSKKEVFLRDRFTCQYCGKKSPDLTLDHVVPRPPAGGAYLGERGGRVQPVQPAEGGADAGGGQHDAAENSPRRRLPTHT